MILRRALITSALAGVCSVTLLVMIFFGPVHPEAVAWTIASAAVTLGMAAVLCVGWVIFTLPPGAPIRTRGMRAGGALVGVALVVLALRTGLAG